MRLPSELILAAALLIFAAVPSAGASPLDATSGSVPSPIADPTPSPGLGAEFELLEESPKAVPEILLDWSANPGVFESDLSRRSGNSLYLESRRQIGEPELLSAKRVDAKRLWESLEGFIGLLSDKNRMSKFELASQMGDALLRIDEATWSALQVGGHAYDLAASIQELRSWLLNEWVVSSDADPGVKALLDAEARIPSVETESSAIRFLALIQTGETDSGAIPIQSHEFGVALMSEEPATIRGVYKALRGDLKDKLALQLNVLLADIEREEIEFEQREKKVAEVMELLGARLRVPEPHERASTF